MASLNLERLEARAMLAADGWALPLGVEAAATGGAGGQYIEADNTGAAYVAASVNSSQAPTRWDVLLQKYSPDGTTVEWTQNFPVNGSDFVKGVVVDPTDSHFYVVGNFQDNNPFAPAQVSSNGTPDIFVAKVATSDGSVEWHRTWASVEGAGAMGVDVLGQDVYVSGYLSGNVDFDGTLLTADEPANGFIVKLDGTDGDVIWANQPTGAATAASVTVAAGDLPGTTDVFIGGAFSGQVTFGSSSVSIGNCNQGPSGCPRDGFVAHLQDTGASAGFTWARHFVGSSYAKDVMTDGTDVLVGGNLTAGATVDLGSGEVFAAAADDAFVARLAGNNGATLWATQISGPGDESLEQIALDGNTVSATADSMGQPTLVGEPP